MEFNRNHYFMVGLVVLFIGIQFRVVDSYELNESTTRWVASTFGEKNTTTEAARRYLPAAGPAPRRVWHPPEWLGWACISLGAVLILHSLAMPRPS